MVVGMQPKARHRLGNDAAARQVDIVGAREEALLRMRIAHEPCAVLGQLGPEIGSLPARRAIACAAPPPRRGGPIISNSRFAMILSSSHRGTIEERSSIRNRRSSSLPNRAKTTVRFGARSAGERFRQGQHGDRSGGIVVGAVVDGGPRPWRDRRDGPGARSAGSPHRVIPGLRREVALPRSRYGPFATLKRRAARTQRSAHRCPRRPSARAPSGQTAKQCKSPRSIRRACRTAAPMHDASLGEKPQVRADRWIRCA